MKNKYSPLKQRISQKLWDSALKNADLLRVKDLLSPQTTGISLIYFTTFHSFLVDKKGFFLVDKKFHVSFFFLVFMDK